MLQKLDGEIRECYRHAAECSRSADQNHDLFKKKDFLDMEKRWLCLARSYEFCGTAVEFHRACQKAKTAKNPKTSIIWRIIISRPASCK
jgi:hypothetical protein